MLNFFKKILTKRSKADTHSSSGDDKEFDLEPKIETDIAKIIQEAAQGNKKLLLRHKYWYALCIPYMIHDLIWMIWVDADWIVKKWLGQNL